MIIYNDVVMIMISLRALAVTMHSLRCMDMIKVMIECLSIFIVIVHWEAWLLQGE